MDLKEKSPLDVTFHKRSELDMYQFVQYIMASVHVVLLTGLDSILKHLETNRDKLEKDLDNWLGYVNSWVVLVHAHHHGEETNFFPVLKAHGHSMETELKAHEKIHRDLDNISDAVKKYKADKKTYSSDELNKLCLECKPNLMEHLSEEVIRLTREELEPKITEKELEKTYKKWESGAQKDSDPLVAFPFVMVHSPDSNKYWTGLPPFVYKVLVPLMYKRHKGWWKYAPYPVNKRKIVA